MLSLAIEELLGLYFPENRFQELEKGIAAAARDLHYPDDPDALYNWLRSPETLSPHEIKALSTHLTIGETYFFREKSGLKLLTEKILPELTNQRKGAKPFLRIWSAGCSSGEEPYSLAILLKETLPDIHNWNITILATDISEKALSKARKGTYTPWSFRDTPESLRNKYFQHEANHWTLDPEIKKMVHFTYMNLTQDIFPSVKNNTSDMDVIFCRNVLMYLTPDHIKKTAGKFYESLSESGWLITSQVELNDEYFSAFSREIYEQGIFYQKNSTKEPLKTQKIFKDPSAISPPKQAPSLKRSGEIPLPQFTALKKSLEPAHALPNALSSKSKKEDPWSLYKAGKYDLCILESLDCLSHQPDNADCLYLLAKSYANTGRLEEASQSAEDLVTVYPEPDFLFLYASILTERNLMEEAEKILRKILYLNPDHLPSYLFMGRIAKITGNPALSEKYYLKALDLLSLLGDHETVEGTEGMTAGRLKEMIHNLGKNG